VDVVRSSCILAKDTFARSRVCARVLIKPQSLDAWLPSTCTECYSMGAIWHRDVGGTHVVPGNTNLTGVVYGCSPDQKRPSRAGGRLQRCTACCSWALFTSRCLEHVSATCDLTGDINALWGHVQCLLGYSLIQKRPSQR
jgi:hypothetical protein